jgi:hypothetical protein
MGAVTVTVIAARPGGPSHGLGHGHCHRAAALRRPAAGTVPSLRLRRPRPTLPVRRAAAAATASLAGWPGTVPVPGRAMVGVQVGLGALRKAQGKNQFKFV